MADKVQTPKRTADLKEFETRREKWPTYKKSRHIGSYVMLLLFLAAVGMGVYYALNHKEEATLLWNRLTRQTKTSEQVEPGQ
jgi:hypothetical protein